MVLVPAAVVGFQAHQDGDDAPASVAAPPRPSPEPEPVSTVPPGVQGWKAVTSAKYGFTYDVPKNWTIWPPTRLSIWETKDGEPTGVSGVAQWGAGFCTDREGGEYDLATTGFQQYVDGGTLQENAEHAASSFARLHISDDGRAPAVKVGRPEAIRVGKVEAVHVAAAVTVRGENECLAPRTAVHAVALPGVRSGHTTMFLALSAQDVPEAVPDRRVTQIIGSLRPN